MTPAITTEAPEDRAAVSHTLAGEHARLMRDVAHRAASALALLDARACPHAELRTLTNYLRTAVLRQVSDEEALLYPHDTSAPPFAELSADHLRLHTLTAQLESAGNEPGPSANLHTIIDELLSTLQRHLADEQRVFAALPHAETDVPSAADLAAGRQPWLPEVGPVLIRLDTLPDEQAIQLCIERLLRLRPGQTAEVHARDEQQLRGVRQWLHEFDAARFGMSHSVSGPDHLLRVACRRANAPAGIGYPG